MPGWPVLSNCCLQFGNAGQPTKCYELKHEAEILKLIDAVVSMSPTELQAELTTARYRTSVVGSLVGSQSQRSPGY